MEAFGDSGYAEAHGSPAGRSDPPFIADPSDFRDGALLGRTLGFQVKVLENFFDDFFLFRGYSDGSLFRPFFPGDQSGEHPVLFVFFNPPVDGGGGDSRFFSARLRFRSSQNAFPEKRFDDFVAFSGSFPFLFGEVYPSRRKTPSLRAGI